MIVATRMIFSIKNYVIQRHERTSLSQTGCQLCLLNRCSSPEYASCVRKFVEVFADRDTSQHGVELFLVLYTDYLYIRLVYGMIGTSFTWSTEAQLSFFFSFWNGLRRSRSVMGEVVCGVGSGAISRLKNGTKTDRVTPYLLR